MILWTHIHGERFDKKKQLAKNIVNAVLSGYGSVCLVAEFDFLVIQRELFDFLEQLRIKFTYDRTSKTLRFLDQHHTNIRFYRIYNGNTDDLRMRLSGFDYGVFSISLKSEFSDLSLNELKRILTAHGRKYGVGYVTET